MFLLVLFNACIILKRSTRSKINEKYMKIKELELVKLLEFLSLLENIRKSNDSKKNRVI